jgi:hypothetical protein
MRAWPDALVASLLLSASVAWAAPGGPEGPQPGRTKEPDALARCFDDLLAAVGQDYLAARTVIVQRGEEAVPFLKEAAARDDWQARTLAEAVLCHIQSPEQIDQLGRSYRREAEAAIFRPHRRVEPPWWEHLAPELATHSQAVPYFTELLLKDRPDASGDSQLLPSLQGLRHGQFWVWEAKRGAIAVLVATHDPRAPAILTEFVRQWVRAPGEDAPRPIGVSTAVARACAALRQVGDEQSVAGLRAMLERERDW